MELTLTEIAELLKISKIAVFKRAEREQWRYKEIPNPRGGRPIRIYEIDSLPEDIRQRISQIKISKQQTNPEEEIPEEFIPKYSAKSTQELKELVRLYMTAPEEHKKIADARLEIIKAYENFLANSKLTGTLAKETFVKLFNTGKIVVPLAFETGIAKISVPTLYRWIEDYEKNALYGLLPKHKQKGRTQKITPDIERITWSYIAKGITRAKRIYEAIQHSGINIAYQTFANWYKQFRSVNDAKIKLLLSPDKFRSEYLPAFGTLSNAEYYGQILMLDATKADVMCIWEEEGIKKEKRLTLTVLLDIYSRDIRFVIAEKENSHIVVDSLLRKWLIEVGVPEKIITDNSNVYKSKHFQQVCKRFDIKIHYTQAYSPEQKAIIERAFGTIATQFFEVLETYTGHSVAERKDIESRKKWSTKIFKDGEEIQIQLSPQELSDKLQEYIEKRYRKEKHTFGIVEQLIKISPKLPPKIKDERILDILLGVEHKRKLTNRGIRLNNTYYISKELAEHFMQTGKESIVIIREDIADTRKIYVYDQKGNFISEAYDIKGLSEELRAIEAKQAKLNALKQARRERNLIKKLSQLQQTPYEIMINTFQGQNQQEEQRTKLVKFQAQFSNQEIETASRIVEEKEEKENIKRTNRAYTSPIKRAREIIDMIEEGYPISQEDYNFLREYSKTPEYIQYQKMGVFPSIDELKIKIA